MKKTLLLIALYLSFLPMTASANTNNDCYNKYINLGNDYSDNRKYDESVAFYEKASNCATTRKQKIISSAGVIAGELMAGNNARSRQLLQSFLQTYPRNKWGVKFNNDNFVKTSHTQNIPSCESANNDATQCVVGDLLFKQKWQANQIEKSAYQSEKKTHTVEVISKSTGKGVTISCADAIQDGMWCQIASGISDPGWEEKHALFPIKKRTFSTISKSFVGVTLRSSANGGYFASQYLFDTKTGKTALLPDLYGRFGYGSFVEENGFLYFESDQDTSFRMATCCSLIDMSVKKRLYKIDPYTLAVTKITSKANLPPKSSLNESISKSSKNPSAANIKQTFTDIWRYHTLVENKSWLLNTMIAFKRDVLPRSEQAFEDDTNEEVIDRMITWAK